MKLRTKFAIALLVVTLVLSAGVYGGLEWYKGQVVGGARAEINETAGLTADQIDSTIREKKDFIGFVASRPEAARFDQSDEFLEEVVDNSRFFAVQLIHENGTIVDFHGDITQDVRRDTIGRDVANRSYFREARIGEVHMTDPEYVNATDQHLVIISAPVFEDRSIVAVLAAAIYVDRQAFFTVIGPLETSEQTVAVRAGDAELLDHHRSYRRTLRATATVESTGWTVSVVRDRSGLIAQLRGLAIVQGVGVLVVLLSVIGFGVWEYRTTLDQTERLLEGFAALERGEFDRSMSLSAGEEWEQISAGFNDLARELSLREQELRQREQRLEVLNRVLRHNLRNSANVILGHAETIRDHARDDAIRQATGDIRHTIQELTELSDKARQIEAIMGQANPDASDTPIDIAAVASRTIDRLESEYPGVEITSTVPDQAWAYALPSIEVAIENLCENACEHNERADPRVEVAVAVDGETVRLRVADNGPGLPEHEQTVLEEGVETPLEHGSGLGLWLVQWAVSWSGGELAFRENDPRGTVASLTLDRVPPEDRPREQARPVPES